MKRKLILFVTLLTTLFSTPAFANEIKIFDYIHYADGTVVANALSPEELARVQAMDAVNKEDYDHIGQFKLTSYCACRSCNGKWYGYPTASGTDYVEGRTIAVDPKVIPLGTKLEINIPGEGWKEFIAEDTGSAIKGNRIDVFVNGHKNCIQSRYNQVCDVRIKRA